MTTRDLDSAYSGEVDGDQERDSAMNDIALADRSVEPFNITNVNAGIPTDLDSLHVGEAAGKQTLVPSRTEIGPGDPTVDPGTFIADVPDVPAVRTVYPIYVATLGADIAIDVVVPDDPAPLFATRRGRMVKNSGGSNRWLTPPRPQTSARA